MKKGHILKMPQIGMLYHKVKKGHKFFLFDIEKLFSSDYLAHVKIGM